MARHNTSYEPELIQVYHEIQLPHGQLSQLGMMNSQMMGTSSVFPGPSIPEQPDRNSVQMLGSYLQQYQFQIQRLLPFVQKLSDLL